MREKAGTPLPAEEARGMKRLIALLSAGYDQHDRFTPARQIPADSIHNTPEGGHLYPLHLVHCLSGKNGTPSPVSM